VIDPVHRRRHASEQRRDLCTCQRVTVDVVDKHQHVAALVTEILGHRQPGQTNPQTVARRFVHLAVNQRDFIQHARFRHFVVEVVTLASSLTNTGEH